MHSLGFSYEVKYMKIEAGGKCTRFIVYALIMKLNLQQHAPEVVGEMDPLVACFLPTGL